MLPWLRTSSCRLKRCLAPSVVTGRLVWFHFQNSPAMKRRGLREASGAAGRAGSASGAMRAPGPGARPSSAGSSQAGAGRTEAQSAPSACEGRALPCSSLKAAASHDLLRPTQLAALRGGQSRWVGNAGPVSSSTQHPAPGSLAGPGLPQGTAGQSGRTHV